MTFKRKNYDYEIEFGGCIDFSFWALPFSICWIRIDDIGCLDYEFNLLFRFLCLQVSSSVWKWDKKITDIETTTVEDLFNG